MSARLEKLFLRYRERGDAAALAEVFDATAPELFRLAQHLVRDALSAEDVLQDTFVAAIDAATRWDASRPLVPWLTGILARKASESRRRARRQVDPQRLEERGERDPSATAEDAEFSRELRAALARLPELYREVLERHLLHGAGPSEIARDLERSPGAVRMQLFRGLEQLRRALPAGFAAGAALALFAPRGLSSVREAVLAHAVSQGAVLAAAGGAAATATALAWPMGAAVALALVLGVWFVRGVLLERPRDLEPASPQAPGVVLAPPLEPGAGADRSDRAPPILREQETAAPRVLRGVVRGPQGEDAAAVALTLRGVARYVWPEAHAAHARPASDGTFEIALDGLLAAARERGPLDALELELDHRDWLHERVRVDSDAALLGAADASGVELWVEVDLTRALVLEGRVERPGPGPAPEVGALPVEEGAAVPRWLDRAVADEAGNFRLRLPAVGEVEVVACAADTLAAGERHWVGAGGLSLPRALRLESGVRVEGTVQLTGFSGDVERMDAAAVWPGESPARIELAGRELAARAGRWSTDGGSAVVAADGGFVLAGLERGEHVLTPRVRSAYLLWPEHALASTHRLLGPIERLSIEIPLATLRVRLLDAAGVPIAGAFEPMGAGWSKRVATHADGQRALQVLAGAELTLWTPGASAGALPVRAPGAGETLDVDLRLDAAPRPTSLRIDLAAPDGLPESIAAGLFHPGASDPFGVRTLEPRGGQLELADPPTQAFELELFAGGAHAHLVDGWLRARAEVPESALRPAIVPLTLARGARLRVTARDAAGRALPLRARVLDLWGNEHPVRFLRRGSSDQAFTEGGRLSDLGPVDVVPNLPAGLWTVEAIDEDGVVRRRHVRLAAGDVVDVELGP
jgi:RNA polymerase sigma-70 factor (ECF subfamily)